MAHDDAVYPDPFMFKPERFMGPNPNPDPTFIFGFGRRICPGRFLAQESLFIDVASLLATFNIKPFVNDDGTLEGLRNEHTSEFVW